jgi:hypothetical protein
LHYFTQSLAEAFATEQGMSRSDQQTLANRLSRALFVENGFDAAFMKNSGKAGGSYLAVFDPARIDVVKIEDESHRTT